MFLESELLIKDPSQEFLREAVLSVPGRVLKGELTFAALGLSRPESQDQIVSYYEECQRLGIIPGSNLHYEYHRELFRTRLEAATFPELLSFDASRAELLFKGGKIHFINFKLDEPIGLGFELLRQYLLKKLLAADYQLSTGEMMLARQYPPRTAQVFFCRDRLRMTGYETHNKEDENYNEELQEWIHGLAEKYKSQILIPVYN